MRNGVVLASRRLAYLHRGCRHWNIRYEDYNHVMNTYKIDSMYFLGVF